MTRRTRLLLAAGYVALFLAAFYVALVLAFPVEALKRAFVATVERESDLTLVIDELSFGWTGGLHARRVALAWPGPTRSIPVLTADRVDLDLALWPAIRGRLDAAFAGESYDGRFDGRVEGPLRGRSADRFVLRLDRLDLGRHAGLAAASGVVVSGRLSGEIAVAQEPPGPRPARRSGTIRLLVEQGILRELPLIASSLPEVGIERATASGRLDGDRLEVEGIDVHGPEVSLSGSGQVGLRDPFALSTLNLTLRLRPERRLPPGVRQLLAAGARPADAGGTFGFVLLGTLRAPELRPL